MRSHAIFVSMLLFACTGPAADGGSDSSSGTGDLGSEGGSGGVASGGATDDGDGDGDGTGASSGGTAPADDGSTAADDTAGPPQAGFDGVTLRENPADPGARGRWSVGARTVTLGGLTVEVWYPAAPGSEQGLDPVVYDIREHLPPSEQDKIDDATNPWQPCECARDLPVDDAYGPYPAIVFVHGTASFRTQSLPQMEHWASRGFVVLAADHPGLQLADMLGSVCGAGMVAQDLAGDLEVLLAAVRGETPGLEFLGDRLDADRIGMAGHSAGGNAIAGLGSDASVLVPMAAGGTLPGPALLSTLVLGGTADTVVQYAQQQDGYASSPSPKRFVGITGAGHLTFSQICSLHNRAGDDLLTIATDAGVCGAQLAGFLFQCSPDLLPDADGWDVIDFATAAAFEETLHCSAIGTSFAALEATFPGLVELQEG